MATFQTAYERLMRTINRPTSETDVLQGAKDAINDAILFLQRNHGYAYTQIVLDVPITASTFSVNLATSLASPVRDVQAFYQVSASGVRQGKPLKVITFAKLQAMRMHYERTHKSGDEVTWMNESLTGWTIEDAYRSDKMAFLYGNVIGVYPTPTESANFVLFGHAWLPALSATSDTNFFLDYALDVVLTIALTRMHLYLKLDSRFAVTEQEVTDLLAGLVNWDAQILTGNNNSL